MNGSLKKPFSELDPQLRTSLARYIKDCRRRDRGNYHQGKTWVSKTRSLNDYAAHLNLPARDIIREIQNKLEAGKKLNLLDIGVGSGQALLDIIESFEEQEDQFKLTGVGLTATPLKSVPWYAHRVGMIESIPLPPRSFDIILSVRGGLCYTLHSFAALENTLNSLKENGVACLQEGRFLLAQSWFRNFLKSLGYQIQITRWKGLRPVAFKIQSAPRGLLDLSSFSRRYVENLNKEKNLILKWGFDRIRAESPLLQLLENLYGEKMNKDLIPGQVSL